MARGKHEAAAARRRVHQSNERVAELEQALRESRELHHREAVELKQALANAENRLVTEVNSMADELVRHVRRECAEKLADEERQRSERVGQLGALLNKHDVRLPADAFEEIFRIFKCQPWDFYREVGEETRTARRASRNKLTRQNEMTKALNRGGFRQIKSGILSDG